MNTSPQYWRARTQWSAWLGRKGTVVASTLIRVGTPALDASTPYPYVIVDFGDERRSFMGVGHEELIPGETVECVWRRIGEVAAHEVIPYGIKVQRYHGDGADEITPVMADISGTMATTTTKTTISDPPLEVAESSSASLR